MNILITNDDGINCQGIYALTKEFIDEGNIIISAPDRQRSASSHSITMHESITAVESDFYNLGCRAYAVSGTPVDCVKLAFEKFAPDGIDLVLSGINDGGNLGTDVLYSGTVSAAIEGALLNLPSIAVSLCAGGSYRDYGMAAYYTRLIAKKYINESFKPGTVLNINFPACSREQLKGIAATTLGTIRYTNSYIEKVDREGNTHYQLAGTMLKTENGSATDIFAVENNYISVTPMHFEFTRYDYLDTIRKWDIK